MIKKQSYLVLFILIVIALSMVSVPIVFAQADRPEFVEGELLVKFHDGVTEAQIKQLLNYVNAKTLHKFRYMELRNIRVPENLLLTAKAWLSRQAGVDYADFNYYRYFDDIPNDVHYDVMWGLENVGQTGGTPGADIDASSAWDITTGNGNVVVAVIDSGIDLTHEDLAANIWTNVNEIPNNGLDDDGNGYIDDVHGWDFSGNDNDPSDDLTVCGGHGTHTSGTIGAIGNNETGVAGINWNVKIMPLKTARSILGIFCGLNDSDIIKAIEYATANGAQVSNNSYGGGGYNQAIAEAIKRASHLFVAAAGNESTNNDVTPSFPANYNVNRIISVAATDHNDNLASFSNFGVNTVDLAAPGVSILSTLPGNNYAAYDGTSMATPHVTGVAALMLAADPSLTHNELKWRLLKSTDFIDVPTVTGGRLNAYNALTLPAPDVVIDITPTGSTSVSPGDTITFHLDLTNNGTSAHDVSASVVAYLPNGKEVSLMHRSLLLNPGQTLSGDFSRMIPADIAPGSYTLMGRAEAPDVSFDEAPEVYTILP